MRAPVAPSGCPSEMPPPFGLTSPASHRSCKPVSARTGARRRQGLDHLDRRDASQASPAFERARARASDCRGACGTGRPREAEAAKRARGSRSSRFRRVAARRQRRGRSVNDRLRVAGGHDTIRLERRLERRELLERGLATRRLVDGEKDDRAARAGLDGYDLALEVAVVDRRYRPPMNSSEYSSSCSRLRFHSSAITSADMPSGTIGQRSPIFSLRLPSRRRRIRAHGHAGHVLEACGDRDVQMTRLDRRGRVERRLQ